MRAIRYRGFQGTANSDYVCWEFSRHVSSRITLGLGQLYGLVILSLYIYIFALLLISCLFTPQWTKKRKKRYSVMSPYGSASNRTRNSCSSIVIEVNIPQGRTIRHRAVSASTLSPNRSPTSFFFFEAGKWIQSSQVPSTLTNA
jgi:hypothetical protein